ncbi:hypothetical protein HY638_02740 [Candidatus Woesearchaeota archaeon]|nr:hypothetical protein [Candidatus Woesearchaeota archaeon]
MVNQMDSTQQEINEHYKEIIADCKGRYNKCITAGFGLGGIGAALVTGLVTGSVAFALSNDEGRAISLGTVYGLLAELPGMLGGMYVGHRVGKFLVKRELAKLGLLEDRIDKAMKEIAV